MTRYIGRFQMDWRTPWTQRRKTMNMKKFTILILS